MNEIQAINIVGGGSMGRAMFDGWLKSGWSWEDIVIIDLNPELCEGSLLPTNERSGACLWVYAVKPQHLFNAVEANYAAMAPGDSALSIAAGITLLAFSERLPDGVSGFRAMPNLAARNQRAAVSLTALQGASTYQTEQIRQALTRLGECYMLDERMIDAFTAVAGSGPAYLFQFVEYLTSAAISQGIEAATAIKLCRQVLIGAASLLEESPKGASELRQMVTSPGGTSSAGLSVLTHNGNLGRLIHGCVEAAKSRSEEISHPRSEGK